MARSKVPSRPQKKAAKETQVQSTAGSEAEAPQSQIAAASAATDFFKTMNNSVEKRNKDKQQRMQNRHKASVKKIQKDIQETSRKNKLKLAEHRKTQLTRLAELVKKRAGVEARIAQDMQELSDAYEVASKEMREMLRGKVSMFE